METLRQFFGSYPADTHIQAFGETLRDLPQQLLGRASDPSGIEGPLRRQGRISGNHKFNFFLQFEARSEHGGLCQTGVLVASATTFEGRPIPVRCKWKRRIGSHLLEIQGIQQSMYHASADDIGMHIVCIAETEGSLGQACGLIGPFELDPITRMSLENILSSGASRFPVRHFRDQNDPHPRDLQIHVTQDHVKVVHPGAERGSSEVTAPYSADYPKVVIHPMDTCKFRLELSEEEDKVYHFVALSRTSRDLIALLIRCFHARQYVATTFMLRQLYQNPATPGAPLTTLREQDLEPQQLSDGLAKELHRTLAQLEKVQKVVRNATLEKRELQEQLKETIESYTQAIEKLHQQIAPVTRGGSCATLQLQIHDAKVHQSRIQLEVQELRTQLEEEKLRNQGDGVDEAQAQARARTIESFKAEITQLRAKIGHLTGNTEVTSQRDQKRADELRRLRSDVESLAREKEALERCATQAEKEKADLIENFLYVKGCLDKLQMASLASPAASPEHERQVSQLRAAYSQVVDERNRLLVRVEAMDKDREKQKQLRESALERVMTANARLLDERDRLEKEKERVSRLYQQTMTAMGAVQSKDGGNPEDGMDRSAFQALQAQLVEKKELLTKREQEGESLRARLRKLALV